MKAGKKKNTLQKGFNVDLQTARRELDIKLFQHKRMNDAKYSNLDIIEKDISPSSGKECLV